MYWLINYWANILGDVCVTGSPGLQPELFQNEKEP